MSKEKSCLVLDIEPFTTLLEERIKELDVENTALRISESNANVKSREYFSECANTKQALKESRGIVVSQAEQIKELKKND